MKKIYLLSTLLLTGLTACSDENPATDPENNQENELIGSTQIILAPGYTFRLANAIITNFHQPESTLILLVAAFIGQDWRKVYQYALEHDFRFLSYGDGSLLFRTN